MLILTVIFLSLLGAGGTWRVFSMGSPMPPADEEIKNNHD